MFLRFGQALPDIPFRLPQQCQRPIPLLAKVMKMFHFCLALPLAHLLCQFLIFFLFAPSWAHRNKMRTLHTDLFYLVRGEKQALARESMQCINVYHCKGCKTFKIAETCNPLITAPKKVK